MSHDDNNPVNVPADDFLAQFADLQLSADDLSADAIMSVTDPTVSDVPTILQAISKRSPSNTTYFRTHMDDNLWLKVVAVFDEESTDRDFYVIPPKLIEVIPPELRRTVTLVPYTTLEKRIGVWPVKHAQDPTKKTVWETTALETCRKAQTRWVRKKNAGSHWDAAFGAMADEPWWPEGFGRDMIFDLALKANIVTSISHPIVQRVRGLA